MLCGMLTLVWVGMRGSMKINYATIANEKLASFRYRIKMPAEYLVSQGHEVMVGDSRTADVNVFSKHFSPYDFANLRVSPNGVFDVCDYHLDGPYGSHYKHMIGRADIITVATEYLGDRIEDLIDVDTNVIPDPYEFEEKAPKFGDGRAVLWFGHASNLPPLTKEIEKGTLENHWLKVISNPNSFIKTVPWSMQAVEQGMDECDLVVIPQEDTLRNRCKGANRMVESIRSGRFVVASPMPAYEQFREWMYLGDIQEGLQWTKDNANQITDRIREAQKYVNENFSMESIGPMWSNALTSVAEIKS